MSAVGLAVDVTAAVECRERAHRSKVFAARAKVIEIARGLAEDGLSAETIREAMLDMADDAARKAALYILQYDEAEAKRMADDMADLDDERDARADKHEAAR